MAHTNQQRKRIRQDAKRNVAKTAAQSSVKTVVKKLETAVAAGDKTTIMGAFKAAMSTLARAAQRGVVSKGAAKRKVSRMAQRIAKASAKA